MRAVRSTVLSFLAALAATVAVTPAQADTAPTTSACDLSELNCSQGATSLHAESRSAIVSSINTGWMPACDTPDANGHCGNSRPIQVEVSMDLAALPTPSVEPLWMVDMARTAVVGARWPSPDAFELWLPTSTVTTDGTLKVSHTLIPSVRVYATLFGIQIEYAYDASRFLTDYASNFNYQATNTILFQPWAFDVPAVNLVPSPSVLTTELLNVKLVNTSSNDIDLGLSAKTSPTFTYRTTKVALAGATSITQAAKVAKLGMSDADFLDLDADVEGELTVTGELIAAPYVAINKIGGFSVPGALGTLDLSDLVKAPRKAYEATPPVVVKFPRVRIHIPLPNIKVPSTLDLGSVQLGHNAEQPATIKNTGELGAKMTFESSDPQFKVVVGASSAAKTDYPLTVTFTPTKEGPQTAVITVKSNDPDQPTQTLNVTASGTAVPVAAPPATTTEAPAVAGTDEGCGCHTAPAGSSKAAFAGLALLGVLAIRRRRSAV